MHTLTDVGGEGDLLCPSLSARFFLRMHPHTNRNLLLRISPPGAGLRNVFNPQAFVSYCFGY